MPPNSSTTTARWLGPRWKSRSWRSSVFPSGTNAAGRISACQSSASAPDRQAAPACPWRRARRPPRRDARRTPGCRACSERRSVATTSSRVGRAVHGDDVDPRRHDLGHRHVGQREEPEQHVAPRRTALPVDGGGAAARIRLSAQAISREQRAQGPGGVRNARGPHQRRQLGRHRRQQPRQDAAHDPHQRDGQQEPQRRARPATRPTRSPAMPAAAPASTRSARCADVECPRGRQPRALARLLVGQDARHLRVRLRGKRQPRGPQREAEGREGGEQVMQCLDHASALEVAFLAPPHGRAGAARHPRGDRTRARAASRAPPAGSVPRRHRTPRRARLRPAPPRDRCRRLRPGRRSGRGSAKESTSVGWSWPFHSRLSRRMAAGPRKVMRDDSAMPAPRRSAARTRRARRATARARRERDPGDAHRDRAAVATGGSLREPLRRRRPVRA